MTLSELDTEIRKVLTDFPGSMEIRIEVENGKYAPIDLLVIRDFADGGFGIVIRPPTGSLTGL